MKKLKKTINIDKQKNYLEDLKNKNLEDKKAKKEAIKKNYDFFIGFAMDELDKTDENGKPYIEKGKILCKSSCGNYKSATLSTIERKTNKIITQNLHSAIGYELDENDIIVKNFFWLDGWTNQKKLADLSNLKIKKEKYNTYDKNGMGKMYVANDNNGHGLLEAIKSKTINRIERIKRATTINQDNFFNNRDSSDSSLCEEEYELNQEEYAGLGLKLKKYSATGAGVGRNFIYKDKNGNIIQRYNELCCFAKDKDENKISVKRLFIYQDWLTKCSDKQINNIAEVQLENFPNEQIRVINGDKKFKMLSTEQFIDIYVKDRNKKKEYFERLEKIKNSKDSNISFKTENNLTAKESNKKCIIF